MKFYLSFFLIIGLMTIQSYSSFSQEFSPDENSCEEKKEECSFTDDAPPFREDQRKKYSVDPDLALKVARQLIQERSEHPQETDEQFLERLKVALHQEMPFIHLAAKKYRNKYHGVIGDIYVLYATPWEYMILYKYQKVQPQGGRGFWKHLNLEQQKEVEGLGLGFSGRYPGTEFRTIPIIENQITITEDGERHVHQPGERAYLVPSRGKFYKSGWILECAHGQLWKAFPRFFCENKVRDIFGQFGAVLRGLSHGKKK